MEFGVWPLRVVSGQSQLFLDTLWALRKASWKTSSRNASVGGKGGSFLAVSDHHPKRA